MRDEPDIHPSFNRVVFMLAPINSLIKCTHNIKKCKRRSHYECNDEG